MFSAEFTTIHKYNIRTREKVSTISVMPYDYTSLYDPQYLPTLSKTTYDMLKSFCAYRFQYVNVPLADHLKSVVIEYNENTILRYQIINTLAYAYFMNDARNWNHFISSIQCEELSECKEDIDRMTNITDVYETNLTSIEYDKDCKFSWVNIFDSDYNLVGYDDSKILHAMNNFCKSAISAGETPFGIIGFSPSKNIKFVIQLRYTEMTMTYQRGAILPSSIEKPTKVARREEQLNSMIEYELLNSDDVDFIKSISGDNTMCDFEYFLNEDGTTKEIYLHNYVVHEFKNLMGD